MAGVDELAAAVKGPRDMGVEVTGYNGRLTGISTSQGPTGLTGVSATVDVGFDTWIVTNIAGSFLNEIAANPGPVGLIGRLVRVHMVNGQPEIAYSIDPATTIATAAATAVDTGTGTVPPPPVVTWQSLDQPSININGVTCSAQWAWCVNAANVCELRFMIRAAAGTMPGGDYVQPPFPTGTIPTPLVSPLITTGKHGTAVMNSTATTVRLDPDGNFYVFSNSNPAASPFVEGSITYQTAAP